VRHLIEAPAALNAAMAHDEDIAAMAHLIAPARDVLYLGRGPDYPLAMEGALKLKEISYIHAEGYASGEMKHGPIALIDEAVPVIVLAPSGPLFEKTVSNMQEVRARGGKVVLISDAEGIAEAGEGCLATRIMFTRSSRHWCMLCLSVAGLPRRGEGDRRRPAAQSGKIGTVE
jgi:glucosamine--fructose-6-phosphate aminotransferase (isomerizing)